MSIEYEALHTLVAEATGEIAVHEVVNWLATRPPEALHQWYIVVRVAVPSPQVVSREGGGFETVEGSPPGYAVILPVKDLSDEIIRQSQERHDLRLSEVPGLLQPALTIERRTMGTGRVRREWVPNSPGRRLVVLEENQVVGLLTDEVREGGFGGFMTRLYGRERKRYNVAKGRITYRCPIDGGVYDFVDLIDLATNRLICPGGHLIEE